MSYSTVPVTATKKFTSSEISIPEKDLDDFKNLLKLSKIAKPTYESLQEDGRFGITHKWISEAKKYWVEEYDWRKCEDTINAFPNFITDVNTGHEKLKIHFVALFSENPKAVPVVLLHGWPGKIMLCNISEGLS
jgi:microsomal epoxide hydrolase